MHRQEAAGRLVDVHDAVCGVLLLKAVELFHALGGLLVAQVYATQDLLDPSIAWKDVESLCVEPIVHQASDRQRAEAQDVGHPLDVLAEPCHVFR